METIGVKVVHVLTILLDLLVFRTQLLLNVIYSAGDLLADLSLSTSGSECVSCPAARRCTTP